MGQNATIVVQSAAHVNKNAAPGGQNAHIGWGKNAEACGKENISCYPEPWAPKGTMVTKELQPLCARMQPLSSRVQPMWARMQPLWARMGIVLGQNLNPVGQNMYPFGTECSTQGL